MSDKIYVQVGVKGRALPPGGESGQILQKASDKDFDLIWTTPAGGTSGNIPQPSVSLPDPDTDGGAIGTGIAFARQDHQHKLNVSTVSTDVKPDGTRSLGSAGTYARTDHVHPLNVDATTPEDLGVAAVGTAVTYARRDHVHRIPIASEIATTGATVQADLTAITPVDFTVSLATADWVTDGTYSDKHTQTITITGFTPTANTVVDLYPDYTVMHQMTEDGTSGLYVENNSGTLTAVAVGEKPTVDLAVSARRIEV